MNDRERAALQRVKVASNLLDDAIRIPGTKRRVGLDPILSILPVGGDAAGLLLSLYPIVEAVRLGVPRTTVLRMVANIAIDAVVGSIPVLGTIFDAVWKANARNVDLMERHLA